MGHQHREVVKRHRLSLFVFIDAFGWELAKRHPFLDDILVQKAPLNTIFGYSSTCEPTIMTGKMPREHGHFAFFAYDPVRSPFRFYKVFSLLPKSVMNRGRIRAKFSQIMKRVHGFTGYFQIYCMPFHLLHFFDYTERRNLFEPNGINGGQSTIFDHLRNNKIPHRLIEGNDENSVFAKANETVEETRVRFLYLFLGRLDAHLHNHGTHSELAAKHIAWYDAQLRELFDSARQRYEEVRLFIFSDHGMTDVMDTCDLMTRIESLGLRFGEDYAAVYDSTMARFWFLNDNARGPIEAVLREEPRGHIMTGEELARYGCDFPDQRYGQLFFLLDPGVLLCPSHMGLKPLAAMHGYTPDDKDSVAAFMTNAEDIDKPAGLADMCALIKSEAAAERVNYCERAG
jgi:hypothetical protein